MVRAPSVMLDGLLCAFQAMVRPSPEVWLPLAS
jgi:hypothetical protein